MKSEGRSATERVTVTNPTSGARWPHVVAWAVTLLAAGLPQIAYDLAGATPPSWLVTSIVVLLTVACVASLAIRGLRPYARFFFVLLMLQPAIHRELWPTDWWAMTIPLPGGQPSLRAEFVLELVLALGIAIALIATGLSRRQVFLRAGTLDAPAVPVRWLFDRPIPWTRLAPLSGAMIGLGTLAFLLLAGRPPTLEQVVAVLPAVLLMAAINAFSEELMFRAAPMAGLSGVIGSRERLLLVVAVFALPHYFGVPFGLVGVVMAGLLAWWLAKCLSETEGLFWPWVIHLVQDVLIFSFILGGRIG